MCLEKKLEETTKKNMKNKKKQSKQKTKKQKSRNKIDKSINFLLHRLTAWVLFFFVHQKFSHCNQRSMMQTHSLPKTF